MMMRPHRHGPPIHQGIRVHIVEKPRGRRDTRIAAVVDECVTAREHQIEDCRGQYRIYLRAQMASEMLAVSSEGLIATITSEGDRDALTGPLRNVVGRDA